MRGLVLLLVFVIVTVDTVRSQPRPPTRTKKGPPPSRRGDNPDFGLPSGKDIPDGRRAPPPAAQPAPAKPAPPAGSPPAARPPPTQTKYAAAPAPVAPANPMVPPTRTKTARGGKPRTFNDNPDYGLPSGKDYPDGRRAPPRAAAGGPPPAAGGPPPAGGNPAAPVNPMMPPTKTRAGGKPRSFNDNPDYGLPSGRDYPDSGLYVPPPVPVNPPVMPVKPACDAFCGYMGYDPVCTVTGMTYENSCFQYCSGEAKACEGPCPCNVPAPIVQPAGSACNCQWDEFNPVCTEDNEQLPNECTANCEGKTILCSSHCPC